MVALHVDSLAALSSSSTDGVAVSMDRVAARLPNDHWLTISHRYRDRGGRRGNNRLRNDLSNDTVRSDDLSEYIGISAPVHSMDGWSLLGRSIHCLSKGDPYGAVHLAYYSELRAALALLASQGIGVFNDAHCVIDSDGACSVVKPVDRDGKPMGTHPWTWLVFQWWAQEPRAVALLRRVIRPGGKSLDTWMSAMPNVEFALGEVGAEWLKLWGIDIGRYLADRDARNAASYWPNTINRWETNTAAEDYQAVSNIWQPLEPTLEARFAELDKHLLRIVLSRGYFGVSGARTTSAVGRTGLSHEVQTILSKIGMSESVQSEWHDFLYNINTESPAVIEMAKGTAKVGKTLHVVEVMCRATMLLRLATGASAILLSDAGIGREKLEFWIQAIGIERGLWQPGASPGDLVDLWADVESALEQIDDSMKGTKAGIQELWARKSRTLAVLGECERVGLWGLGL